MPDIRQKVEEDRGLIKKIQLMVPGIVDTGSERT